MLPNFEPCIRTSPERLESNALDKGKSKTCINSERETGDIDLNDRALSSKRLANVTTRKNEHRFHVKSPRRAGRTYTGLARASCTSREGPVVVKMKNLQYFDQLLIVSEQPSISITIAQQTDSCITTRNGRPHHEQITRLQVRMKSQLFDLMDSISIIGFLSEFKTACEDYGV